MICKVNNYFFSLYKPALECVWPRTSEWARSCHVKKDSQYGGTFDGNACRRLLQNTDVLDSMINLEGKKFVTAFRDLNIVIKSCFGSTLEPHYEDAISCFKRSFMDLCISVTPKIHAIFFHVIDFCSSVEKGLGCFSEQASESVHYSFKCEWKKI